MAGGIARSGGRRLASGEWERYCCVGGRVAHLTREQCSTYAAQGYLVVRDALPQAVLDSFIGVLEAEVDRRARAMHARGETTDLFAKEPFATRWYRLRQEQGGPEEHTTWHACVFGRELYALWTHAAIVDVVESLIGPEVQVSGDWLLRPKLPAEEVSGLPWHQDSGYMKDTEQYHWPTVWVPLVPVDRANGAMECLPGTHLLPIQEHGKREHGSGGGTPQQDPSAGREAVTMCMDRGDFVIFHNHLFHRSTIGGAASVRWSIDFRFSPAGTPIGEHLWFHGMQHVIRSAGDPSRIPSWEQVVALWQRSPQRTSNP